MRSYFSIFVAFLSLDLRLMIEYRKAFILEFIFYLTEVIIWLFFWNIFLSQVDNIAGWKEGEFYILVGYTSLWLGIWASLFIMPVNFVYRVNDGLSFEKYLTKPSSIFFLMFCDSIQFRNVIPQVMSGLIVIVSSTLIYSIEVNFWNVILSFIVMILGIITLSMIYGTFNTLSFKYGRFKSQSIFHNFIDFTRFPLNEIEPVVKRVLTFGIPSFFLATAPTLIYLGLLSNIEIEIMLVSVTSLTFLWIFLFSMAWNWGIRQFTSTGG